MNRAEWHMLKCDVSDSVSINDSWVGSDGAISLSSDLQIKIFFSDRKKIIFFFSTDVTKGRMCSINYEFYHINIMSAFNI